MSKRNQSSRRRNYGRRQHELNERSDRSDNALELIEFTPDEMGGRWSAESTGRESTGPMLQAGGTF